MKLSVIIPAHNEQGSIESTVTSLAKALDEENIPHEILVVNDNSSDNTASLLAQLKATIPSLRVLSNSPPNGFGYAIRCGLEQFTGDIAAIYMADASDRPRDLIKYYQTMLREGVDCVFGSRWTKQSNVIDYPFHKKIINRMVNWGIQILFQTRYNDATNAFKMYRRETIDGLKPFLSAHFNLTVELPLKAIIRGYKFSVVPNDWVNRTTGVSKLRLKEMGSRYLFIILYCLLERLLTRGDYHTSNQIRPVKALSSN